MNVISKNHNGIKCRIGLHKWSQIPTEMNGVFSKEVDSVCERCGDIHMLGNFESTSFTRLSNSANL